MNKTHNLSKRNIRNEYNFENNDKEKIKVKSLISNNISIIPKKFLNPTNMKKIKILKDNETSTDTILEVINISDTNDTNDNKNNNNIDIKKYEISKTITNKIMKLKKNVKSNNNIEIQKHLDNTNSIINNKRFFESSSKNKKIKNANVNLFIEKKKFKSYNKDIIYKNSKNILIKENRKNNFTKLTRNNNNINILSEIHLSKDKNIENNYTFESNFNNNKLNGKIINKNLLTEKKKNKKKLNISNKINNKIIKFSPCLYNLFNVPIIDNNNSLEETIKQQTVSNFNNKYNIKFKTKNPIEKEKITTLFNLLKKHKNLDFQKNKDLKKYSISNKYKNPIKYNKFIERPKSGNIKKIKIKRFFSNKNLKNLLNKKSNKMISIKTMNYLEYQI